MTQYIQREIIMEYTQIDWDRKADYTDAEFQAIWRNEDGDICLDLDVHLLFMTAAQRKSLTGDDQYRADLADEEMAYLHEAATVEFEAA